MNILKRIGWIFLALLVGGAVNMLLVVIGPFVFPIPQNINISTMEGLKKAVPLFTPVNYVFPFLAHALGTFVSALACSIWLREKSLIPCLIIGALNFSGGLTDVLELHGAMWFNVLDLSVGYIPMALLGWKLGLNYHAKRSE